MVRALQFRHLITFIIICYCFSWAGTTGKLVGTILDQETGKPLPGANIVILDTYWGASTDLDGNFLILNLSPGYYDLEISMLGYQKVLKKNVKISVDLTTTIKLQLTETTILGDEVVVVAERPLIRKDITAKQTYIDSKDLTDLPVRDFEDVLALQAGVTRDAAGRLHIRGGRSGEVAYLIDGVYVDDPLRGGFDNETEESNETRQTMSGNLGLSIGEEAIDEMVVISGTFNAEYGNVMSGIVNIVTKEPSRRYTGKLEVTSGFLNSSPYRQQNSLVPDKNPITDASSGARLTYQAPDQFFQGYPTLINAPSQFQGSFSGPIPGLKKLAFFFSGKYANFDSYLPHGFDLERNYFAKLTYFSSPTLKINFTENFSQRIFQVYSHAWKYIRENQGLNKSEQRRHILNITHTLSSRLFYNLNFSLSSQKSEFGVWDWGNNRFKNPDTEYLKGERDNELEFYIRGTDDLYINSSTDLYSFKGDLTYQLNYNHEIKSGLEIRNHDLNSLKRLEPWPEEGGADRRIPLEYQPLEWSAYVQDKMEFDYLIINAGLRLDYVDVKARQWKEIDNPLSELEDTSPSYQVSPRLGMAFPISEEAVFHFAYGHFFQFPSFADVYTNLIYQDPDNLGEEAFALLGNPGVQPQKTVSYEAGLKFQPTNLSALEITAFYKDLENLLGTRFYRRQLIYQYSIFTNIDYGSVKGIDLSWRFRNPNFFNGVLNYTYSVATGNASFPTDQAYNAYFELEEAKQEYPLDFDRRHIISASMTFYYPIQKANSFWEKAFLSQLSLNFIVQYASGFPYTPITDDPTLFIPTNSARMPWTGRVDIRLEKRWPVWGTTLGAFVETTNLFNNLNALRVQPYTGRLWDTGKLELLATGTDYVHNPSDAGPPRLFRIGALIIF
jgi:outer membrane receptor protein involved in Fe transport